ncbi:MAG: SDR family oxidoreductase, partial [Pseudomonadota bacterium]|nr:SDR family oxidoreductase [Pseudomonadota bacterium]
DLTLGYGAAKTGILGLIRGMAVDLGKRNIRVNAVAAGLTQTGMTSIMFDNPEWIDPTLSRTPLQRLGQPEDIAGAVLFASSSAAQWMTGQAIIIDGGYTIFG